MCIVFCIVSDLREPYRSDIMSAHCYIVLLHNEDLKVHIVEQIHTPLDSLQCRYCVVTA